MQPSDVPDADLRRAHLVAALHRIADGQREALREVYDLTAAKLFGVCLRICCDRDIAEDLLQETFIKVWYRAARFQSERGSPIAWLCAIARNTAIDWRRSRRMDTVDISAAYDLADDTPDASQQIEADQTRARIFDCLDALGGQPAEAIRAAFFNGLSYSQLAARMAVPLGTIKSWVRRGLQQLKGCLGDG